MNYDKIMTQTVEQIFSNLEEGQIPIIQLIAENGPLNSKQIGKITSRFTQGFDRWGVKKRIEGSTQFLGLIPHDFLKKKKINLKESRYELTLKGIFASLITTSFEKNYLIWSKVDWSL